jgi:hypothetical protein
MSVMVAYRWPVSVLVATMLTPGNGTVPAFTVPWTEPPAAGAEVVGAEAAGAGLAGAELAVAGCAVDGAVDGAADCPAADAARQPLTKHERSARRRIDQDFLKAGTQLRPSSRLDVFVLSKLHRKSGPANHAQRAERIRFVAPRRSLSGDDGSGG